MNIRVAAIVVGAIVAAGAAGWIYGASGRSEVESARREAVQRADLNEARSLVLEGQLALSHLNFGDAAKRFDAARLPVQRVQTALRETGLAERAGRLEIVLSHLRDAQRLATGLDASAAQAGDAALQALAAAEG